MFDGKKVKSLREKKGLNRTKLTLQLYNSLQWEVTDQSISNWENGVHVPNGNDLAILAKFFGVDIGYFFNHK